MEYIYTALLLHKAGKKVNEASVKAVLHAAGVSVEDGRVKALCAAIDGVDIDEVVKRAAVPLAAPVSAAPSVSGKKEEKPKEEGKSVEQAAAGLSGLFG